MPPNMIQKSKFEAEGFIIPQSLKCCFQYLIPILEYSIGKTLSTPQQRKG